MVDSEHDIISWIVRLNIFDSTSYKLRFSLMEEPLSVTIPLLTLPSQELVKHLGVVCLYWDAAMNAWASDGGMFLTDVAAHDEITSIKCSWNHLTDFAVALKKEIVTPSQ